MSIECIKNAMTVSQLIEQLQGAQGGHSDRPVVIETCEDIHGDSQLFTITGIAFSYVNNRVVIEVGEIGYDN